MSIPKIIHYCWFGGKKKPDLVEKCIDSWKYYLKDYEIMEWNEENFPIKNFKFANDTYKDGKWAFLADYCRLWALYNYGGIYLDTDMEVLKPLNDFLEHSSFGGLEDYEINMAIWGCEKYDRFISEVLKYYNNLNYEDYKEKLSELAIPIHLTIIAKHLGYKAINNKVSYFYDGVAIYPKEYFYPKRHSWQEPIITDNTYTIHHYEGTWRKPHQIFRSKLKGKILSFIRGFK
ncbi:glycosyltransferase [Clostridium sp. AL.422]|uniref:glycosyltransferase family 32 protein n=1 Tax=Clostridium TaxID=1485 RepID=UPI00293DAD92|nr:MULTISPECIES: glycosyltransferase [unclassified Clostridium]MDV4150429.1 glycosyltransferase [Clostridium sp. AL.422]